MKHLRKIILALFLMSSFSSQPAHAEPIIIGAIIMGVAAVFTSIIAYDEGKEKGAQDEKIKQAKENAKRYAELQQQEKTKRAEENKQNEDRIKQLEKEKRDQKIPSILKKLLSILPILIGWGLIPQAPDIGRKIKEWWKQRKAARKG